MRPLAYPQPGASARREHPSARKPCERPALQSTRMAQTDLSRVALVVPVRDEEAAIPTLMASVAAQTRQPDELIVVDAGSRDDTVRRIREARWEGRLLLLTRGPLYPGEARNEGVLATSAEWIAFTDAGITLDPRWLEELASAAGAGVQVVMGNSDPLVEDAFSRCVALVCMGTLDESGWRGPTVPCMLIRRDVLEGVGGFQAHRAAEDQILFDQIKAAGFKVAINTRARVRWEPPRNLSRLFARFMTYSYHNLAAGRARFWHLGLLRSYVGFLVAATVATALGGVSWALVLVPAFFLTRASRAAWQKRDSFDFPTFQIQTILGAGAVLAIVDLATLAGAGRFLFRRVLGRPVEDEQRAPYL